MLEILFSIFLGVLFGLFTGLLPSLHPNNLVAILLSFLPIFLSFFSIEQLIAFVVSLSITHSFTSFLSSVIFGIPEEETSLSVLPSHKMILEGKGYYAIYLTVLGGLYSTLFCLLFLPLLIHLGKIYKFLIKFLPFVLLFVLIYLILLQRDKTKAILIVVLSGLLGYIVLNLYFLKSYQKLTPLFSGLFGLPLIILSLLNKSKIPEQKFEIEEKYPLFESFLSFIATLLIVLFPTLTPSIVISIIGTLYRINPESFLIILGGITTVDSILSFVSLYSTGNPRSGSSVFVQYLLDKISFNQFLFILSIILITIPISAFLTLLFAKFLLKRITKINYFKLNLFLLFLVILIIYFTSGFIGILILLTSTFLGILCNIWNVNRTLLVSCLMVPLIINFIM